MKILFLVRHSKAVTRRTDLPDFQRTLVKAGEKKTVSMAKKLKKEGVMPDLMISSTANRALETAHLFAKRLGYSNKNIVVKDALYNEMSPEALLYIVRQVEDEHQSMMLFGHNPAFTDFAAYLVRGFDEDIPKTGIVGIRFDKDKWKDIVKGSGKLEFFEYPKRLSKTLKGLEAKLQSEIALNVQGVLDKMDRKSGRKMKKAVKKSSDRIAKDFLKILKVERAKEEKKALAAEKAKKRKAKPKSRQRSKPESKQETKPESEPKLKQKPTPEPKTKAVPKPKPKPRQKSGTRTESAPRSKPESKPASKQRAETPRTAKAASTRAAGQIGIRKQSPKSKVSETRKTTPKAKRGPQSARKRG